MSSNFFTRLKWTKEHQRFRHIRVIKTLKLNYNLERLNFFKKLFQKINAYITFDYIYIKYLQTSLLFSINLIKRKFKTPVFSNYITLRTKEIKITLFYSSKKILLHWNSMNSGMVFTRVDLKDGFYMRNCQAEKSFRKGLL